MGTVTLDPFFNAAPGEIWVCGACGKTNTNKWAIGESGWDESCALNAALCFADQCDGKWQPTPEQVQRWQTREKRLAEVMGE